MTRVQTIEKRIGQLSRDELAELRAWFEEFDSNQWDRQIATDAKAGKLDELAARALETHKRGESREI